MRISRLKKPLSRPLVSPVVSPVKMPGYQQRQGFPACFPYQPQQPSRRQGHSSPYTAQGHGAM